MVNNGPNFDAKMSTSTLAWTTEDCQRLMSRSSIEAQSQCVISMNSFWCQDDSVLTLKDTVMKRRRCLWAHYISLVPWPVLCQLAATYMSCILRWTPRLNFLHQIIWKIISLAFFKRMYVRMDWVGIGRAAAAAVRIHSLPFLLLAEAPSWPSARSSLPF